MQLKPAPASSGAPAKSPLRHPALALVTLVPLLWLLSVTMTAGLQKILHADPRIGFLAAAGDFNKKLPALEKQLADAQASANAEAIAVARKNLAANRTSHFNNRVDAVVTAVFVSLVVMIVSLSVGEWGLLLAGRRRARLHETEPVWLPEYAVVEGKPLRVFGLFALLVGLARELTGEAALERVKTPAHSCACAPEPCPGRFKIDFGKESPSHHDRAVNPGQLWVEVTERRFTGVNRCC
jgi:carbon starvation protein